jgi:Zn-dependent protease/predicted transcriptional regulator
MRPQIRLGNILGVTIGLHYTWFIIAFLIILSLAAHFRAINPGWGEAVIWTSAILTGILFFVAIVVHELAHAMVARHRGLPVRSIVLFALGGMAQIEKDAADPKTEFWMGIAGPIMSVVLGSLCLALAWALGWSTSVMTPETPAMAVLVWLGYINLVLAAFNMIPGFPLDGGRVLRAAVWWTTGDRDRSTRIAARIGQAIAFFFIVVGFWRFFNGGDFGGLWLALIGWFLLDAARASYAQLEVVEGLRGIRVRDVMSNDCPTADPHWNLEVFAEKYLMRSGRRCFVVKDSGRISGLITPNEVTMVERARWPYTTVAQVMRPLDQLQTVTPETPLVNALQVMGREDVNQLPVVSKGQVDGIVSRGHILQLLESRAELHM